MTEGVRLEEYQSDVTVTISKSCRVYLRDVYGEERCVGTVIVDTTNGKVTITGTDFVSSITRYEQVEAMRAFCAYKDKLLEEAKHVPSTVRG